ncbi:MFS transporter [Kineococcus sp. TBRC 1896]|uniref:MFS transporter n=1 Tax=Kineococcus mangrovi TaxID=1660183 RepID=A0ABV4I5G2_9ACTN
MSPLPTPPSDPSVAARPNPWRVGVIAGMASYIDAAALVTSGIALVIYGMTVGITQDQIALLSGALTFSVAAGALVGGRLGDRFGRRRVFLVTMLFIVAGSALATVGTTFGVLLVAIVLLGLGVGADLPVSLATIAEAADDGNRGKIIILSNSLWLVGIIVAVGMAAFVGDLGRLGGQIMVGHVGVVALVVLLARLTVPESQVWLAARRAGTLPSTTPGVRVRDLLRTPYARPMVALVVFYALTNLGANTYGQYNTFMATTYAGATVAQFNRWALVVLIASLVVGLGYMRFVDTHRRFAFFAVGALLTTSSYFVLGIAGFTLTTLVVALVISSLGNSVAFEGIMKIWTQESFPTTLRSTAQGTIVAVARISAAILAAATPALLRFDNQGFFLVLGAVVAVGFLVAGLTFRRPPVNTFVDDPTTPTAETGHPATARS